MGDIVIVFDCGATNVRVIALNGHGKIVASSSFPNSARPDPYYPSFRIWDVNVIWSSMCQGSRQVLSRIKGSEIAGLTVTTFGVDGTLFDINGEMLYPVISWQCSRTNSIMSGIDKYLPIRELYGESGVLPFNFNTINKLIWFNENRPGLVDRCHRFLYMPSVFTYFLTGEMMNDSTMAGTSMLTSLRTRNYSETILERIRFPQEKLGPLYEPGTVAGKVTGKASSETGIPEGVPVILTGHDTQFAIFGSGAARNQPVLSSGTWEILMVRSEEFKSGDEQLEKGITTELDSRAGLYNIGNQWIASGIIEWARKTLYSDLKAEVYEKMIEGAEKVPHGSEGVKVIPKFYEELSGKPGGEILGLTLESTRDQIYRAMLESLAVRLGEGMKVLEDAGGFKSESILCVGGGSKNRLWNKLRADFTGLPIKIIDHKETTVLGASMFVQAACGNAATPEEAMEAVEFDTEIIEPQSH